MKFDILEKQVYSTINASIIDNIFDGQKKFIRYIEEQIEKLYVDEVPKLSPEQRNMDESDLNDGNNITENINGYHSKRGGDGTRILYAEVILGLSVCYGIAFIAFNRNDEEYIGDYSLDEEFEGGVAIKKQDKEQLIDVCFDKNYQSET